MFQSTEKYLRGNKNIPLWSSAEHCEKKELERRIQEIIKCKNDIEYFAENYFYIVHPDFGKHIIKLFPKQREFLNLLVNEKRIVVTASRQSSKCVCEDTKIKIKNKKTEEIKEITIGEFKELFDNFIKIKNDKKFIEKINIDDWMVETDDGWHDILALYKTIEYDVWEIKTETQFLRCADNHILFDENFNEIFVKDLVLHQKIQTKNGLEKIVFIKNTQIKEHMYDLELSENSNHRYYTNNILSHNTTTYTIFALWKTLFFQNEKILITANKKEASIEFVGRIKLAYEMLPNWIKPRIKTYNKSLIEFCDENGGKIQGASTSPDSARGLSCSILIIDEAAHIVPHIAKEFITSVYPIISAGKNTQVIMVSTPNGLGNFFADIYFSALNNKSKEGYKAFRMDWWDVPWRDEEWKKITLASMDNDYKAFSQEFENNFLNAKSPTLVSVDRISELRQRMNKLYFEPGELTIKGENEYKVKQWFLPRDDRTYIIGCDIGDGVGRCSSVIYVLDITDFSQITLVAKFSSNTIPTRDFAFVLYGLATAYNKAWVSLEANGLGRAVIDVLTLYNYENIVKLGKHKNSGIISHVQIKIKSCLWLKDILYSNNIKFNFFDTTFFDELTWFSKKENAKVHEIYSAINKKTDDHIFALIWALYPLKEEHVGSFYLTDGNIAIGENILAPRLIKMYDAINTNFSLNLFEEIPNYNMDVERELEVSSEKILKPKIIDVYEGYQKTSDFINIKKAGGITSDKPYKRQEIDETEVLLQQFLPNRNDETEIREMYEHNLDKLFGGDGLNFSPFGGAIASQTISFGEAF